MKLIRFIVLVLIVGYFSVGCTSTESPEQLIERPVYDKEKQSLYVNVKRVLDKSAVIVLPKNSSEVSSINSVDLDNDGKKELIVFEKQEDINNSTSKVGFIILSEENEKTYVAKDDYIVDGNSIEYANFYDLDNDGQKEIVLATKTDSKTTLEVLKFEDKKIVKLHKYNPTWIANKDSYTEMKVKIGDLDDDDKKDIVILNYNPDTHDMAVSLTYYDEYLRLVDFKSIADVRSLDTAYVEIYKLHEDKKGIVVDTRSFKEKDAYMTQILYLENNMLQKVFSDTDEKLKKQYYMPVEDINGDGIVEIPVVNNSSKGYRTKTSSNISWYSWNGTNDEFMNLAFVSQIYYNYKNNFKLWIPNVLANKISIEEEYRENKILFEFYYYDSMRPQSELEKLFTITKVSKNKIDESKGGASSNNGGFILSENETETFSLLINKPQTLKKLNVSKEAIKEYFLPIYVSE